MRVFDYGKLKDPQYFCDGRIAAHSDHKYFASKEDAELGVEEYKESLNGVWKFHYARNYKSAIPGFEKEDYCCRSWEDIYVPAHIQMEGYDIPQYTNIPYPWEGHDDIHPGEIPEHFNPVASYVKYIEIPERMKGKRIFISFQGAESGLAVWLNGKFVGYSEDTFTPSEFELTDYLVEGENKLAAQVFKWTASSWCEDQDFFRFSGIYRDVYLYTIPEIHVRDMEIKSVVDETLTKAPLKVRLDMEAAKESGKAVFTLSKDGNVIFTEEKELAEEVVCEYLMDQPLLWSAEDPQLYDLTVEIYDAEGTLQEVIPEKVGFRRFEMKDGLMMINGKRIVFKGANRHEFSSVSGRVVSEAELRKDLTIMKQNNINAIRMCHYPNSSLIYRLCDEYGFYTMDETNLETHGSWDIAEFSKDFTYTVPHNKMEWLEMLLDRANSMYQRDKNHPAIIIWSCGNEAFGGKVIYEMSQFFRKVDPDRLVHYEGIFHDRSYNETSDMESQMYPSVKMIKDFLAKDRSKPFICCEYCHTMGNSGGALNKYTDLTDEEPLYQGGFIWDYIDQSIWKKDRYGKDFLAYGGDFGERPTDYNFSGNGIAYGGDRDASPKMQEVKFCYQNISVEVNEKVAKVINKNLFTNTDKYNSYVTVARDGKQIKKVKMDTCVAPLSEETYELPVPVETAAGEYTVTVSFHLKEETIWADAGHEVAFGQYVYEVEKPVAECKKKLTVINSPHYLGVRGDNFEVLFSIIYGGLVSYKYAGREMIEAIPRPNFWRAPNDNDNGNMMQARYAQWKIASLYVTHKAVGQELFAVKPPAIEVTDTYVSIGFVYNMPTTPTSSCDLKYTIYGDGSVKVNLDYDPVKELGDMPEFGMMFKINADYDHVKWYGLGPEETYADRKLGAKLGIYENLVKDNMAGYLVPQECGNKEEVRWAEVTDRKGRGMRFAMTAENGPMCFSALPYTPHELENAMHEYELPEVHYTVIRAAKAQMGIGGDDSWGAKTHPEYLLNADEKMEFSFVFKGI